MNDYFPNKKPVKNDSNILNWFFKLSLFLIMALKIFIKVWHKNLLINVIILATYSNFGRKKAKTEIRCKSNEFKGFIRFCPKRKD